MMESFVLENQLFKFYSPRTLFYQYNFQIARIETQFL